MVNELYPRAELMGAVLHIAERIASNSPTAVQAVKRAVQMGQGETVEQAVGRPEFLEQAAKELLDEQWKKVTTAKLPKTTELQAASRRIG